jgi:hypothetical protein
MLKSGIDFSWNDIEDFGTHIGFLVSALSRQFPGSLEILMPGSSDLCVGGKNGMRSLRPYSSFLLRQEGSKGSGPFLRGHADLPGGGDPTGLLPKVQESEAGENEVACGQPFLYKAIWLLCRTPMSGFGYYGCCQGAAPELEDCEVSGKGIHAGAVEASGDARAEGNWD